MKEQIRACVDVVSKTASTQIITFSPFIDGRVSEGNAFAILFASHVVDRFHVGDDVTITIESTNGRSRG